MADKRTSYKKRYALLHRILSGVSLVIFMVMIIGGLLAEVRLFTIAIRTAIALVVVALIGRVVLRVVASYEEMNGGKA